MLDVCGQKKWQDVYSSQSIATIVNLGFSQNSQEAKKSEENNSSHFGGNPNRFCYARSMILVAINQGHQSGFKNNCVSQTQT